MPADKRQLTEMRARARERFVYMEVSAKADQWLLPCGGLPVDLWKTADRVVLRSETRRLIRRRKGAVDYRVPGCLLDPGPVNLLRADPDPCPWIRLHPAFAEALRLDEKAMAVIPFTEIPARADGVQRREKKAVAEAEIFLMATPWDRGEDTPSSELITRLDGTALWTFTVSPGAPRDGCILLYLVVDVDENGYELTWGTPVFQASTTPVDEESPSVHWLKDAICNWKSRAPGPNDWAGGYRDGMPETETPKAQLVRNFKEACDVFGKLGLPEAIANASESTLHYIESLIRAGVATPETVKALAGEEYGEPVWKKAIRESARSTAMQQTYQQLYGAEEERRASVGMEEVRACTEVAARLAEKHFSSPSCGRPGCPMYADRPSPFTLGNPCPSCGYPGLKSLGNTCRHAQLRYIRNGPNAGKFGCLEPGCKAVFKTDALQLHERLRTKLKCVMRGPDQVRGTAIFAAVTRRQREIEPWKNPKDGFLVVYFWTDVGGILFDLLQPANKEAEPPWDGKLPAPPAAVPQKAACPPPAPPAPPPPPAPPVYPPPVGQNVVPPPPQVTACPPVKKPPPTT